MRLLFLLVLLCSSVGLAPARAEAVRVPGPDGIMLNAELYVPRGVPKGVAILALHGCGGPNARRDAEWAQMLAADGHVVLLPDSYGSRGLTLQCTNPVRGAAAAGLRRQDALSSARWLAARPGVAPGGVALVGWSDGATTAMLVAGGGDTTGLIRGVVAFYPVCGTLPARWKPAVPELILMGEFDQRSPPAPCQAMAERVGSLVTLVTYTGALHDFDLVPKRPAALRPVKVRRGAAPLPTPPPTPNLVARDDSQKRVPAFLASLP